MIPDCDVKPLGQKPCQGPACPHDATRAQTVGAIRYWYCDACYPVKQDEQAQEQAEAAIIKQRYGLALQGSVFAEMMRAGCVGQFAA